MCLSALRDGGEGEGGKDCVSESSGWMDGGGLVGESGWESATERGGKVRGGGGGIHWRAAQLCVGAKPWLTCEPNYGVERHGEGGGEGAESRSVFRRAWFGHAVGEGGGPLEGL